MKQINDGGLAVKGARNKPGTNILGLLLVKFVLYV